MDQGEAGRKQVVKIELQVPGIYGGGWPTRYLEGARSEMIDEVIKTCQQFSGTRIRLYFAGDRSPVSYFCSDNPLVEEGHRRGAIRNVEAFFRKHHIY